MTKPAAHQLSLPMAGSSTSRLVRTTRVANKKRGQATHELTQACLFDDRRAYSRIPPGFYSPEVIRDADHPVDIEMSGYSHEQHVLNRAARVLAGTFEPLPGVPRTRGDCPADREHTGCPYVRCRFHLWRIDGGIDGNRAGRPGLARVPRNEKGLTVRFPGDMLGDRAPTTLMPRWLEPGPVAPSCALDEVDRLGKMTNEQTGHAMNRHRTLVARELKTGTRNAIEEAEEMGMDAHELMTAIRAMGEKPRKT